MDRAVWLAELSPLLLRPVVAPHEHSLELPGTAEPGRNIPCPSVFISWDLGENSFRSRGDGHPLVGSSRGDVSYNLASLFGIQVYGRSFRFSSLRKQHLSLGAGSCLPKALIAQPLQRSPDSPRNAKLVS